MCVGCKLTALDGKDGDVMNRVGLAVEKLSCADDPAESVHIEEPLQVGVSVDGVPGSKNHSHAHTRALFKKIAFGQWYRFDILLVRKDY